MIKPTCDFKIHEKCEGELKTFGAILFSPPKAFRISMNDVKKFHICVYCYDEVMNLRNVR